MASLIGFVWIDVDGDTALAPDGTEDGAPGVSVTLFDDSGIELDHAETDDDGRYTFADVVPGRYVVAFLAPPGYAFAAIETDSPDATRLDGDLTDDLFTRWGIDRGDIVVADVIAATATASCVTGRTDVINLVGGMNTGLADAALAAMGAGAAIAQDASDDVAPFVPPDNTDIAAREPGPEPSGASSAGDSPDGDPSGDSAAAEP
jgi:hypothetical protein